MADSNDGDRSEILGAPDPARPSFEQPEPDRPTPPPSAKAPTAKRWALWGTAVVLVAAGAVTISVVINENSEKPSRPLPRASSAAPKPKPPRLPLSAVHDAQGRIVTLPDIRRILGATPLPGVALSDNQLVNKNLGNIKVTEVTNEGHIDSASQYRSFNVRLVRFPSDKSIKRTFGKVGPGPHRTDAHHWAGPSTDITDLGGPGIVYQFSDGPFEAKIPNKAVEFDYVGPNVEARYRNVTIDISFESANFTTTDDGKVKVSYPPYNKSRRELIAITRKIVAHL